MNIGDKKWHAGDEVTITSEPYNLYGGEWQDAVTDSGKTITIATERHVQANVDRNRADWKDQQSQFARLHK